MFVHPLHRQNQATFGDVTKNISYITLYKEETRGAKGEQQKTPANPRRRQSVDARRLKEGEYAPRYSITLFLFLFVCTQLTADGPQRARLPIPPTATLPPYLWSRRIFSSLPVISRCKCSTLTCDILSRCKCSTLTTCQPMIIAVVVVVVFSH